MWNATTHLAKICALGPSHAVGPSESGRSSSHCLKHESDCYQGRRYVPTSDLERTQPVLLRVGFEIPWPSEDLAYVRHGQTAPCFRS